MELSGQGVKLNTHLHLVPRLEKTGAIHLNPVIRLHSVDRENVLRRVLEELFKELPTIYGTKGLLTCSQGPVTGLLPDSGEPNPTNHILGGNLSLKTIPSTSSPTLKV